MVSKFTMQVTVGDFKLNDGVSSDAYPLNTHIVANHFHEIGVTGKRQLRHSPPHAIVFLRMFQVFGWVVPLPGTSLCVYSC